MYAEKELERIYENMNDIIFDGTLPAAIFTISKGEKIKLRWYVMLRSEKTYNIIVNYKRLFDDVDTVYMNLFHQMIHIYCSLYGIKDTCRNEQYHNSKFRKNAMKFGLIIDPRPKDDCGFLVVGIKEKILNELHEKIVFSNNSLPDALDKDKEVLPDEKRYSFRPIIMVCPGCTTKIVTSPKGKVICGNCSVSFVPLPDKNTYVDAVKPTTWMCPGCGRTATASSGSNLTCGFCYEKYIVKKRRV